MLLRIVCSVRDIDFIVMSRRKIGYLTLSIENAAFLFFAFDLELKFKKSVSLNSCRTSYALTFGGFAFEQIKWKFQFFIGNEIDRDLFHNLRSNRSDCLIFSPALYGNAVAILID